MLGEAFDPDRYRMAVEVAQLVPDLEILPNGGEQLVAQEMHSANLDSRTVPKHSF